MSRLEAGGFRVFPKRHMGFYSRLSHEVSLICMGSGISIYIGKHSSWRSFFNRHVDVYINDERGLVALVPVDEMGDNSYRVSTHYGGAQISAKRLSQKMGVNPNKMGPNKSTRLPATWDDGALFIDFSLFTTNSEEKK